MNFVHLHLHTEYSMLDGACRIEELYARCARLGMPAFAVTDHGVMHGIYSLIDVGAKFNRRLEGHRTELVARIRDLQSELTAGQLDDEARTKATGEIARLEAELAAFRPLAADISTELEKATTPEERIRLEAELQRLPPHVKPIAGCEAYIAAKSRHTRTDDEPRYHLVLLAKNKTGYTNLCRLSSLGFSEGFYRKPRIDLEILEKYSEGLIVSSACIAGEIATHILAHRLDRARESIQQYKRIFGPDYYLEMMLHPSIDPARPNDVIARQIEVVAGLILLSFQTHTPLLITNDVHFLRAEDADLHDSMVCMATKSKKHDEKRLRYSQQEFLKSPGEMRELFLSHYEAVAQSYLQLKARERDTSSSEVQPAPDFLAEDEYQALVHTAMEATVRIAECVEEYELKRGPLMPKFAIPEGFADADAYLRELVYQGAIERWGQEKAESSEYRARLDFELKTISRMGFPGYFLVVWDFVNYARTHDISVGPGRGSAAGSAVSYCLHITDIDPIRYDLLFERFLNPGRVSLPDIDIDFDDTKRHLVIEYVQRKYGAECVAGISSFGRLKAKSAVGDVARIHEVNESQLFGLKNLLKRARHDTFAEIRAEEGIREELAAIENAQADRATEEELTQQRILRESEQVEGLVKNLSQHACGYIIGNGPISDYAPLCLPPRAKTLTVQYEGKHIENLGLIKMDFLGLITLSIIETARRIIRQAKGIDLDIARIPLDDRPTLDLFARGETVGLFQFESAGMQSYLRKLRPDRFEDLVAMNALFRPGPMQNIPKFIARKHNEEPISYDLPEQEKILADTYGVTVYQEQVILLSRELGGLTPSESDNLRKAIGKKNNEEMAKLKDKFFSGCAERGHPEPIVRKIWCEWEEFAKYAFNKSHSVCYAFVGYQTGYLKAHFPSEYMAACLQVNQNKASEIAKLMREARRMKIKLLPPDVNESGIDFKVLENGDIRFSLPGIKGMGAKAMEELVAERQAKGPYTSLVDLLTRLPPSVLTKKQLELLAFSGAIDRLTPGGHRALYDAPSLMEGGRTFIDDLIAFSRRHHTRGAARADLFQTTTSVSPMAPQFPPVPEYNQIDYLDREGELLGIYLSAHPLDKYELEVKYLSDFTTEDLRDRPAQLQQKEFKVGGLVRGVQERFTRNNQAYKIITLEDYRGTYDFRLFARKLDSFGPLPEVNDIILCDVHVEPPRPDSSFGPSVNLLSFKPMADFQGRGIRKLTILVDLERLDEPLIEALSGILAQRDGATQLEFKIIDSVNKRETILASGSGPIPITTDELDKLNELAIQYMINNRLIEHSEEESVLEGEDENLDDLMLNDD